MGIRRASCVVSLFFLFGCAGISVQIPKSKTGTLLFKEQSKKIGFLDIMSMQKKPLLGEFNIKFKFLIRQVDKPGHWITLENQKITNMRYTLPEGDYVVRADFDNGSSMRDVPISIIAGEFTLLYYYSESATINNPKRQYQTSSVASSMGPPRFAEVKPFPPTKNDETSLQKRLLDPDWRVRAHSVLLLGQFGTTKSLPLLKGLSDDVVLHAIAERAIDLIQYPDGHEITNSKGVFK